jgi:predicted XRE-type DNA-binding protein
MRPLRFPGDSLDVLRELPEDVKDEIEFALDQLMKKHGYVEGSGNVYADLGVVNPQEARAKADLAHRIVDIIEARKLTQVEAGKVLGVDQPKISALKRGRLTDFSIERLVGFLLSLGHDVRITVTSKPRSSRKPPTLEVSAMGAVAAVRR